MSMELKKRKCNTSIKLTPYGADFLQVIWDIGGNHHRFFPSAAMGYQFAPFLAAVYFLYDEGHDNHRVLRRSHCKTEEHVNWTDSSVPEGFKKKIAKIDWDEEGHTVDIYFERTGKWNCPIEELRGPDPVNIRIVTLRGNEYHYKIDGRDLCYAVAKACTRALKTYGIWGYYQSSASEINDRDYLNIEQLLFIKAYALDAMEVRSLKNRWKHPRRLWPYAEYSSYEKEIELLLFDM